MISDDNGTHKCMCVTHTHTHPGTTLTGAKLVSDGVAAGAAVRHTLTTHTQECGDGTVQVPSFRVVTSLPECMWGRARHRTPEVCQGTECVCVFVCVLEWKECMTDDDRNVCASLSMCAWMCVIWRESVRVCVCLCACVYICVYICKWVASTTHYPPLALDLRQHRMKVGEGIINTCFTMYNLWNNIYTVYIYTYTVVEPMIYHCTVSEDVFRCFKY